MSLISLAVVHLFWLFGLRDLLIVLFAWRYRSRRKIVYNVPDDRDELPIVAFLYCTHNDFDEDAATSCLRLDYPCFHVYVLDDSTDPAYVKRINIFTHQHPTRVTIVRRRCRQGFKAGNLNHALRGPASQEPFFAIVDADEILPSDFLLTDIEQVKNEKKSFTFR
jgi:cellulose synthase/poly-beta-1,6-N-acetylglucosamine synthase-like glycosyltransferase